MTDLQRAKEQGQAQFANIREMVALLNDDNTIVQDQALDDIQHDPLSVQVRSGWYTPGARDADTKPLEYEILLCTGGPACRIIGELNEHGEPETAQLQVQDWFTPWADMPMTDLCGRGDVQPSEIDEILLTYARCFYFGE